ncbi:ATP-binding protein [Methylocystis sp. FS]|uniref:ATP-binding protein n=1 Tax=Methylocystis silviterrae TaxID=2743612 RepID=UPI0015837388|nr:ATP-binding protein [Methylocystis silviterrae]NUJ80654.1 ATP-binding protein [Methylocystis silviterrae]
MCETVVNLDIVVPNQTRYLRFVGAIAEQLAKELDVPEDTRDTLAFHLNLALTEAVANAIQYSSAANSPDSVRISFSVEDANLSVRVFDHGEGFDLAALPTPEIDELRERGRGIFFIRSVMDSVQYHKTESGNVLEMRKKIA